MLVTASMALFMGRTTLLRPVETDPTQVGFEGIFGWMIMELAILTVQVVWHGLITIRNTRRHLANRHSPNVASNVLVILAALVCAYRGWLIQELLMMGISIVGIASGLTNLYSLYTDAPSKIAYLAEVRRRYEVVVGRILLRHHALFVIGQ